MIQGSCNKWVVKLLFFLILTNKDFHLTDVINDKWVVKVHVINDKFKPRVL